MNKLKSSKYIYIALLVVVVLAFYFYWNGKNAPSSTIEEVNTLDQAAGARILVLLNQVSALEIDTKLFENTAYATLQDYTVEVPSLPVGRVNPFAPI